MLHLLGGPPRCGKTTLVARAAGARGMGWLSTDAVRSAVQVHIPLMEPRGIGKPHGPEADRFFSSFERLANSCAYITDDYVLEGVGFYPRHVAALAAGIERRAVFVGMSRVRLEDIFAFEGRNRWHREVDEAGLELLPDWIEGWSLELEAECAAHGFPYVDLAPDFAAGQREVERRLFGDGRGS